MKIRRFSSHYALMPDGTLGKWPVVEITSDGEIVSVSASPDGLKEQPSLEFHGGILIPGFVDASPDCNLLVTDNRSINRHNAAGTLILGCSAEITSKYRERINPPFFVTIKNSTPTKSAILSSRGFSMLDRLKTLSLELEHLLLVDLLLQGTATGADILGMENLFGRLKPKLFAGLLVLEQIDLQNMRLTSQTRARWLLHPKNPLL